MEYPYMSLVVPSFVLVPIVMAIIRYKTLTQETKVVFYYLLVTAVAHVITIDMARRGIPNLVVFHFYTIVETLFFLQFFFRLFSGSVMRKLIRVLMIAFTVFCLVNLIFFQSIAFFNTYTRLIECIIFILLICVYWWLDSVTEHSTGWATQPVNWILSGILLYFSSSFFLFIFTNFMFSRYSLAVNEMVWNIHATLVLIMYLLFATAFYQCRK